MSHTWMNRPWNRASVSPLWSNSPEQKAGTKHICRELGYNPTFVLSKPVGPRHRLPAGRVTRRRFLSEMAGKAEGQESSWPQGMRPSQSRGCSGEGRCEPSVHGDLLSSHTGPRSASVPSGEDPHQAFHVRERLPALFTRYEPRSSPGHRIWKQEPAVVAERGAQGCTGPQGGPEASSYPSRLAVPGTG